MKLYLKKIVLFIISVWLITSCKTASLTVEVLKPAQITVPSHIKKLAVVNRSLPEKSEKLTNIVEGLFTGEQLFMDREASDACIKGVADKMIGSPRFTVTLPGDLDLRGTGTSQWPVQLDWQLVETICKKNNADALVVLETFDSNSARRIRKRDVKKKVSDKEVTIVEFVASLDMNVIAGWRIYDPLNKKIVDQSSFTDSKAWDAIGNNENEAYNRLPQKRIAVKETGYFAGQQYAVRISPLWVKVVRSYFVKGNDDFKDAKYKVRTNSWNEAAALWKKNTTSNDNKISGRACYNMALAYEIEGDLETAIQWATKAYNDYHLKTARSYITVLQQRLNDQKKLNEQMGE